MRILLAFDKFKDALCAQEACDVAARALGTAVEIESCPLTDGGDGFARVLTGAAAGEIVTCTVTGPRSASVNACYGVVAAKRLPGAVREKLGLPASAHRVAVIEMAQASGLALLASDQRDLWHATSYGTGELISAAADAGADAIILGVGGSATHDVGLGALTALGLEFLDKAGARITSPAPHTWERLAKISGRLRVLPPIAIACDVTNPLMGMFGAANVYAQQKGMPPEDFTRLEDMTGRLAALLCAHAKKPLSLCETPGAGAAGGMAFGLLCAADAKLVPGFELVSAWLDLDRRIAAADVVITGEGRFDNSSLHGKGPGAVAQRALELDKCVHVFAGAIEVREPPAAINLHAITPPGTTRAEALARTRKNLANAVRQLRVTE